MNSGDKTYIWQHLDWPTWRFDLDALAAPLAEASRAQGHLYGRLSDAGFGERGQAALAALTHEVIDTSAIEGEQLNTEAVRSSVARRLGVDIGALAPIDRDVEGVVGMVLDATTEFDTPLDAARLACSLVSRRAKPSRFSPSRSVARRPNRSDAGDFWSTRPVNRAF